MKVDPVAKKMSEASADLGISPPRRVTNFAANAAGWKLRSRPIATARKRSMSIFIAAARSLRRSETSTDKISSGVELAAKPIRHTCRCV